MYLGHVHDLFTLSLPPDLPFQDVFYSDVFCCYCCDPLSFIMAAYMNLSGELLTEVWTICKWLYC